MSQDLPPVDIDTPNSARMYDYFLGGSHNFEVDRVAAERAKQMLPDLVHMARGNRAFLGRAVRYCLSRGVDQFLDLGSGIPTVGAVHEIARADEPRARVAYVDYEAVAAAVCADVLGEDPLASIVCLDVRDVEAVMAAPGVRDLLDLSRPVALLTVALLHFVPDSDDPAGMLTRYRAHLAPGSFHVLSHFTADASAEAAEVVVGSYRGTSNPITPRSRAQVEALLVGTELVEPGIAHIDTWHGEAEPSPAGRSGYAAVGRIPA